MKRSDAIELLNIFITSTLTQQAWRVNHPDSSDGGLMLIFIEKALKMVPQYQDADNTTRYEWEKENG